MRKHIAILVSAALLSCVHPTSWLPVSAQADTFARERNIVSALGLMEEVDAAEAAAPITRGAFAAILVRAICAEYPISGDTAPFSDVDAGSEAYAAIMAAKQLGIVNGDAKNQFHPEAAVSGNEAVKMLMSALGYGAFAQVNGGYPYGYLLAARRQSVYTPEHAGDDVTTAQAAKMIYDALEVPMLEVRRMVNETEQLELENQTGKNILDCLELTFFSGQVTAVPYGNLFIGEKPSSAGHITVSGRNFRVGSDADYAYFCMDAAVYYRQADDSIQCIAASDDLEELVEIDAKDIVAEKTDKQRITYCENGRERKISLSQGAVFVYNGEGRAYDKRYVTPKDGKLTVIKSRGCNDTVCVREIENVRVLAADVQNNIYFKTPLASGRTSVTDEIAYIEKNGQHIAPSVIKETDTVSVEEGERIVRLTVCDRTVAGEVEELDSERQIVVGDTQYRLSPAAPLPTVGKAYVFYLNFLDEICFAEDSQDHGGYGYLLDATESRIALSKRLLFKILRKTGVVTIYETAEKLTFNNVIYDINQADSIKAILYQLEQSRLAEVENGQYEQLITYDITAEGKIKSLTTSACNEGDNTLRISAAYDQRRYRKEQESLSDFFVDAKTLTFQVPKDKNDEAFMKNFAVSVGLTYVNEQDYYSIAYDCDENHTAKAVVVFSGLGDGGISIDTMPVVFDHVGRALGEDDETIDVLHVFENGAEKSYEVYPDSKLDFSNLHRGDILKLSLNGSECTGYEAQLVFPDHREIPENVHIREGAYSSASYPKGFYQFAQSRKVFGAIASYGSDKLAVDCSTEAEQVTALYKPSSFAITLCDFQKDKIFTISASELGAYQQAVNEKARVFVHTRYGGPVTMIVYLFAS